MKFRTSKREMEHDGHVIRAWALRHARGNLLLVHVLRWGRMAALALQNQEEGTEVEVICEIGKYTV